jgi:Uma2 family endonuclease
MATTPTRLTIDDFERLPDELAKNHELVDGELIDVSGNTLEHNRIASLMTTALWLFVREHGLGTVLAEQEYDFGGNVHGPDVSFLGLAKRSLEDSYKRVQRLVPDLAIEIVSEYQPFMDLVRKKDRYQKCGTAEVWIVSPESREVYVYSEQGNRILGADADLTAPLLPGFQIRVSQIFETF